MKGYGNRQPIRHRPTNAKIAINFVINYEEGAEHTPVNGDEQAETYGAEFPFAAKPPGMRNFSMESLFEYGSRAGIWRLLRLFEKENIPITLFATGFALTLNPELCDYIAVSSHEVAGHGWRWIDYATLSKREEEKQIRLCIDTIHHLTGKAVQGWYTGRRSANTRDLLLKIGGLVYDSDSYADDLPYFEQEHLIIPYTLDCNDFRFTTSPGFGTANDFLEHLKNTLVYLQQENRLALVTVGLHSRIAGHPARCLAVSQFINYIKQLNGIWIARRIDIAHYWIKQQQNLP